MRTGRPSVGPGWPVIPLLLRLSSPLFTEHHLNPLQAACKSISFINTQTNTVLYQLHIMFSMVQNPVTRARGDKGGQTTVVSGPLLASCAT
ncbi:uncharacterized protein BKA55DRAFT_30930 [Fusarium redolens]|uniref:Uncharacterized protein n=1 Tax=Fusarium redolens TaxID=48865 RepID=A0A9P9KX68_FUSRE|nr:uncharacterized protein BKA55DRAFT_30930 [Fusarium redolens]KAH7270003.1 hypothetical protein BKA55DRAFT_30930 [Fusarium redolens]